MTEDEKIEKLKELYEVGHDIHYMATKQSEHLYEKLKKQYDDWKEEVFPLLLETTKFQIDYSRPHVDYEKRRIANGDKNEPSLTSILEENLWYILRCILLDIKLKLQRKEKIFCAIEY